MRDPDGTVRPFENEAADEVAASLGLTVRNPETPELLGTTFLLVEPTVSEHDLVVAIERYWWPALEEDDFNAVVEGDEGLLHPRPRSDSVLASFRDAYELATIPQDNAGAVEHRRRRLGTDAEPLGQLGLLADLDGWSYQDQTGSRDHEGIEHRSLVALVRKPRMVVEYLPVPQQRRTPPPHVRGVFVADDRVNGALRDTEPMGHDAWQTGGGGESDGASTKVARAVIANINRQVREFRAGLNPPERPPEDIRLDLFDSLMRRILRGTGSGKPAPPLDVRPVSIELRHHIELADGDRLCVVGRATVSLHDDRQVVEVAQRLFEAAGYGVVRGTLRADAMGWPQTRRRSFLVARRDAAPIPLDVVAEALADAGPRTLEWAIGDLTDREDCGIMDVASEMSPENRERVDWLFDNGEYDLPNAWRPECHRDGTTYGSVYGRMWPDKPAPTITTGFMTPGRGRYVHPTRRRTLTPREAARIQGFPDTYRFVADPRHPPSRAKLAKWIGDAVPMPLGYGAALSALGPGLDATGGSGSSGRTDSDTHLDN
ncbi:MAG: DNA cytosine methyltransferase [bacterium]|nr:DNA cytosine methyltransferase [bacterium]